LDSLHLLKKWFWGYFLKVDIFLKNRYRCLENRF
jgi:hypothetical protein